MEFSGHTDSLDFQSIGVYRILNQISYGLPKYNGGQAYARHSHSKSENKKERRDKKSHVTS